MTLNMVADLQELTLKLQPVLASSMKNAKMKNEIKHPTEHWQFCIWNSLTF